MGKSRQSVGRPGRLKKEKPEQMGNRMQQRTQRCGDAIGDVARKG